MENILWVIYRMFRKRRNRDVIMWNGEMWRKLRTSGSSVLPMLVWRVQYSLECDIVKGYGGRSSIESLCVFGLGKGTSGRVICNDVPCAKNRLHLWLLMRAPCNSAFVLVPGTFSSHLIRLLMTVSPLFRSHTTGNPYRGATEVSGSGKGSHSGQPLPDDTEWVGARHGHFFQYESKSQRREKSAHGLYQLPPKEVEGRLPHYTAVIFVFWLSSIPVSHTRRNTDGVSPLHRQGVPCLYVLVNPFPMTPNAPSPWFQKAVLAMIRSWEEGVGSTDK